MKLIYYCISKWAHQDIKYARNMKDNVKAREFKINSLRI